MGTKNNINQGPKRSSCRTARVRKQELKSWKTTTHGKAVPVVTMTKERSKKKQKQLERALKHEQQSIVAKGKLTLEVEMKDAPELALTGTDASEIQPKSYGAGTTLGGPSLV